MILLGIFLVITIYVIVSSLLITREWTDYSRRKRKK